ncbi:MAG: enoyl-CoA hydratase/isomerase family protein [Anaerolineae bacterium]
MSDYAGVAVKTDDLGVVTITIDRPAVLNALDWAAMDAFATAVADLAGRLRSPTPAAGARGEPATAPVAPRTDGGAPRVVIVTGAGDRAFCVGGDQSALESCTSPDDGARLAALMGDALLELERLPVPVIAAINGYALGGGSEIALACDLRVADEAARLGLVHLDLALIPGWGGGQRLARQVGYGRAAEMLLTARVYDARELREFGLVNAVAPRGQALPAALELATRLASADPGAVRAVKELLAAAGAMPYESALAAERELFAPLWVADAHLEALRRFAARRAEPGPAR